jgi:hypothetical protein
MFLVEVFKVNMSTVTSTVPSYLTPYQLINSTNYDFFSVVLRPDGFLLRDFAITLDRTPLDE